jgi:hypothetical protein
VPPNLDSRSGTRRYAKLLSDFKTAFVDQDVSVRVENEIDMSGVAIKLSADCVEAVPLLDDMSASDGGLGRFHGSRMDGWWGCGTGSSGQRLQGVLRIQRQTEPNAHIGQFAFEPIVFLSQTKSFKMLDVRFSG